MVDSVSRPSTPANLGFPELWPPTYYATTLLVSSLRFPSFATPLLRDNTMFQTAPLFPGIVLLLGFRLCPLPPSTSMCTRVALRIILPVEDAASSNSALLDIGSGYLRIFLPLFFPFVSRQPRFRGKDRNSLRKFATSSG